MPSVDPLTIADTIKQPKPLTQRQPLVPARFGRLYLAVEFGLLYVVSPFVLYVYRHFFGYYLIPVLLAVSGACVLLLVTDKSFDRRQLRQLNGFAAWLKSLPYVFIPLAAVLAITCAVFRPDLLLAFPRNRPFIWLMVMALYPLLSVYPQEVIYRTFFFHRYRQLFQTDLSRIVISGLSFGLAHLFFANWIAPVLTALGGMMFARTWPLRVQGLLT